MLDDPLGMENMARMEREHRLEREHRREQMTIRWVAVWVCLAVIAGLFFIARCTATTDGMSGYRDRCLKREGNWDSSAQSCTFTRT